MVGAYYAKKDGLEACYIGCHLSLMSKSMSKSFHHHYTDDFNFFSKIHSSEVYVTSKIASYDGIFGNIHYFMHFASHFVIAVIIYHDINILLRILQLDQK